MKLALFLLLSIPFILNGQADTTCEKLMNYTKIQVYDGISASLEKGDDNYLCPSADTKLEDIKITIEQGVLKIRKVSGKKYDKEPRITVIYKNLKEVEGYGKANIDTRNLLKTDTLKVLLRSGAKFYADLDVKYLEIEATEGGLFKGSGYAVEQNVNVAMKATYSGFELEGEHGNVKSTTGAIAKINMVKKVNAQASTGGQVRYRGTPSLDNKTSMGGKIIEDQE